MKNSSPLIKTTPDQVIARLDELNYFVYADPADQNQIKAELGKGLAEQHFFPYIECGQPKYEGKRGINLASKPLSKIINLFTFKLIAGDEPTKTVNCPAVFFSRALPNRFL